LNGFHGNFTGERVYERENIKILVIDL
jgi:hypothetical protein